MILEKTLLTATVFSIAVNLIGWEGLRRYFKIARGRGSEDQQRRFLHIVLPWAVRIEFIYYLGLSAFAFLRPQIIPVGVVIYLVVYHVGGFILNERHEAQYRATGGAAAGIPRSSLRLLTLRVISFLDGAEMALLIYICLVLSKRTS